MMGIGQTRSKPRKRRRRHLLVERLGDRRVLAAITGTVFHDLNDSLRQETDEPAAAQRLIYIDSNENAQLDPGERVALGEEDGSFEFPSIGNGSYLLRLFNGTDSQTQTVPVSAALEGRQVAVADARQVAFSDGVSLALTDTSVVVGDLETGTAQSIDLDQPLVHLQTLPDGRILVIGDSTSGDNLWIADPATLDFTSIDTGDNAAGWSQLTVDGSGRGVLLQQGSDDVLVRSVDASTGGVDPVITTTEFTAPANAQVLTSGDATRSLFAWNSTEGMSFALWSNSEGNFISKSDDSQPPAAGLDRLLAFDDASGLFAVSTVDGGVIVRDVNLNFASLLTLEDIDGPVAIDGNRELLINLSSADDSLKLIDLRDGALIADLAVDLSTVGEIASLALGEEGDAIVVLGAAGIAKVGIRKSAGHRVTVSNGRDPKPVAFGVQLVGDNTAPQYQLPPSWVIQEDKALSRPAPEALNGSVDGDDDFYVVVQTGEAMHGTASVRVNGSIQYTPVANFHGADSIPVVLHDGRDVSSETSLNITVQSVPDLPNAINITIPVVPESIEPDEEVGTIQLVGGHGGPFLIEIDDPRFIERDGNIIFMGPPLNFEADNPLPLTFTVTDTASGDSVEQIVAVTLRNENQPINGISPADGSVVENRPGETIVQLVVDDPDSEQSHSFTVDDERFTVDEGLLKLADGVALDFETEPQVVVNVTATEVGGENSFTQAIAITVINVPDQPSSIELSGDEVKEFVAGDVVGEVTLDGEEPSEHFSASVDDPRFEIDGTTLKLRDDQFVNKATQAEIQLVITATDGENQSDPVARSFLIEVLENAQPFHNPDDPYDVNLSGDITSSDVIAIINHLNRFGPGPVEPILGTRAFAYAYDVNGDGSITALDALLLINEIQRRQLTGAVGEPEETGAGNNSRNEIVPEGELPLDGQTAPEGEAVSQNDSWWEPDAEATTHSDAVDLIADEADPGPSAENLDETLRLLSED